MEKTLLTLVVLLVLTNLLQVIQQAVSLQQKERLFIKRRLQLINKPAIKSYTLYGDILDCVEIRKQLAFDHPLLKNHSIQMKPSFKVVPNQETSTGHRASKTLTPSHLLPKNIVCPRGTVLVRRIQEKDLAMEKFKTLLGMAPLTSNSSKRVYLNNDSSSVVNQAANFIAVVDNIGASGNINVWSPEASTDQFILAYVLVAIDVDLHSNGIAAGWAVDPYMFQNFTRLFTYWTNDGGISTGCFNVKCPGFVQVSQKIALGLRIHPTSVYGGDQYHIAIQIQQDQTSKHWWLKFEDELVGYWPKEVFTTLKYGAGRVAWGGEISSPTTVPAPAMGSGHFPEEGFRKACFINELNLLGPLPFPSKDDLKPLLTKPDCYKATYIEAIGDSFQRYVFFGGPSGCML